MEKKYYFVLIRWNNPKKSNGEWQFYNMVLDYHPTKFLHYWTKERIAGATEDYYCIDFWEEITKEQFELLDGLIGEKERVCIETIFARQGFELTNEGVRKYYTTERVDAESLTVGEFIAQVLQKTSIDNSDLSNREFIIQKCFVIEQNEDMLEPHRTNLIKRQFVESRISLIDLSELEETLKKIEEKEICEGFVYYECTSAGLELKIDILEENTNVLLRNMQVAELLSTFNVKTRIIPLFLMDTKEDESKEYAKKTIARVLSIHGMMVQNEWDCWKNSLREISEKLNEGGSIG